MVIAGLGRGAGLFVFALHRSAAPWASVNGFWRLGLILSFAQSRVERGLQPLERGFSASVEETPVADAMKAGGKSVKEKTAEELNAFNAAGFVFFCNSVFDTNANFFVLDSEDAMVADDAVVDVLPEIFEGVFAGAGRLDVNAPIHFPEFPIKSVVDVSFILQPLEEAVAEPVGERPDMDEKFRVFEENGTLGLTQANAGNNVMDMWMKPEVLGPALIGADKSAFVKTGSLRIGQNLRQGLAALLEKRLDDFDFSQSDRSQLAGEGEGDEEVRDGQELVELLIDPLRVVRRSALGAEPVVAAVPGKVRVPALAVIAMPSQDEGSALEDGLQGLALVDRDGGAMPGPEGFGEAFDDLHHGDTRVGVPLKIRLRAGHGLEKRRDQFIDTGDRLLMADRRQMRVDRGRLDVGVPEILLHLGDRDPGFEQMGGERVAQDVRVDVFGDLCHTHGVEQSMAQTAHTHRILRSTHPAANLLRSGGSAADLGKDPARIAMVAPVTAKLLIHRRGEDCVMVFAALAIANQKLAFRTHDVVRGQLDALADTKPARVKKQKRSAIPAQRDAGEDAGDFPLVEHRRQALAVRRLDVAKEAPIALEHPPIELLRSGRRLANRPGRPFLLAFEMDVVTPQLLLVDVGRVAAVKLRNLADSPVITLLRTEGLAA